MCALERFRNPAAVGGAPDDPRVTAWLACDPLAPLAMLGQTLRGNQRPFMCPSSPPPQGCTLCRPITSECETEEQQCLCWPGPVLQCLLLGLEADRLPAGVDGQPAYPTTFHVQRAAGYCQHPPRQSVRAVAVVFWA